MKPLTLGAGHLPFHIPFHHLLNLVVVPALHKKFVISDHAAFVNSFLILVHKNELLGFLKWNLYAPENFIKFWNIVNSLSSRIQPQLKKTIR